MGRLTQLERASAAAACNSFGRIGARDLAAALRQLLRPAARISVLAWCAATTAGCAQLSLTDAKGSIHYVVLGFGVVSIPKPATETAVLATKLQAVGITVSNQPGFKFNAGYAESSLVTIPDRASDVRVEVSQLFGGPVTVDVQSAILREMKSVLREHSE